jgi:hypothetical protein
MKNDEVVRLVLALRPLIVLAVFVFMVVFVLGALIHTA